MALDSNAPIWEQNDVALTSLDERDLLLPLIEGIRERPMWNRFLHRLRQRTGASQACLMVRMTPVAHLPPTTRVSSIRDDMPDPELDLLSDLGLIPYAALRQNRVYALEEMLDFAHPDTPDRQRAALKQAGIAHARFIRISSAKGNNAWLILLSERQPFDAGDSALLDALAPHVAIALDTLEELGAHKLRAAIAEQVLALLGIGQAVFDAQGRVILSDSLATQVLGAHPGSLLPLPAGTGRELADACQAMTKEPATARKVINIASDHARNMLVRPLPVSMGTEAVAVGAIRLPQDQGARAPARIVARLLGLSEREAALAETLSRGASILEAGAQLRLTPETARNYTKRAYAKTGASGQADLVRMILSGLTPLA